MRIRDARSQAKMMSGILVWSPETSAQVLNGYKTVKCTTPKCKKHATYLVTHGWDKSKPNRHAHCEEHAREIINNGRGVLIVNVYEDRETTKNGYGIYRKSDSAAFGWAGWSYSIKVSCELLAELNCPNPYALEHDDGSTILK